MRKRRRGREQSAQSGASKQVSGANKRANGRASGPVLQSAFLVVLDHSGVHARVCRIQNGMGKYVVYLLPFFVRWKQSNNSRNLIEKADKQRRPTSRQGRHREKADNERLMPKTPDPSNLPEILDVLETWDVT